MKKSEFALNNFLNGYNCCQAIVLAFKDELKMDEQTLKALSSSFGGGISRLREVCGCISAMGFVLGKLYGDYDVKDNELKAKHYELIQKLSIEFKEKFNSYLCHELLSLPKGIDNHVPEVRTNSYYEKRPCGKFISYMAELIEKEIAEHGKN